MTTRTLRRPQRYSGWLRVGRRCRKLAGGADCGSCWAALLEATRHLPPGELVVMQSGREPDRGRR
jgi:hypothetical protein